MPRYSLTGKADTDIQTIAERSINQWGMKRAENYVLELHKTFERLAEFPELGREAGHIRPAYLEFETGSHMIFYRKTGDGIIIIRVLRERMDFKRHL